MAILEVGIVDVAPLMSEYTPARIQALFAGAETVGAEEVAEWNIPRPERTRILITLIPDVSDLRKFKRGCITRGQGYRDDARGAFEASRDGGGAVQDTVDRANEEAAHNARMRDAGVHGGEVERDGSHVRDRTVRVAERVAHGNAGELNRQLNRLVTIHTTLNAKRRVNA